MGFWEELTTYLWNWFVWAEALGGIIGCWQMGSWGLFWDDDDGLLTSMCFEIFDGLKPEFPYEYVSSYAADA